MNILRVLTSITRNDIPMMVATISTCDPMSQALVQYAVGTSMRVNVAALRRRVRTYATKPSRLGRLLTSTALRPAICLTAADIGINSWTTAPFGTDPASDIRNILAFVLWAVHVQSSVKRT